MDDCLTSIGTKETLEEKNEVFERYLRCWKMVETMRDRPTVNRRDLINEIFKDNLDELGAWNRWIAHETDRSSPHTLR